MNNVYAGLKGGLGNQIFQVANGYAYSKKYGKNLILDDSKWFAGQGKSPRIYKETIFKNFEYVDKGKKINVQEYNEPKFDYVEIPNFDNDIKLVGYYQSLKYFEEIKDEFISKLWLPYYPFFKDSVAVHIRRGDYLKYKRYNICDTNYFRENIKKFQNKKIHIFTDSKEYVVKEFCCDNIEIIQTESELNDLASMSNYDNLIISNSTFSWWASLLGVKKEKIIAPSRWFNESKNYNDIYRDDFTISKI
jgi:hypothetical protein